VVEDCEGYTNAMIADTFGDDVAELVENLTDIEDKQAGLDAAEEFKKTNHGLNGKKLRRRIDRIKREVTKGIDREHSAKSTPRAQTVKYADLTHNSFSIVKDDPHFSKIFLPEKSLLLDVMTLGDSMLRDAARTTLASGLRKLDGMKPHSAARSMGTFIEEEV
jgi:hypothetical protein